MGTWYGTFSAGELGQSFLVLLAWLAILGAVLVTIEWWRRAR